MLIKWNGHFVSSVYIYDSPLSQKTRYILFESDTHSQDILVGALKSGVTHFAAVTTLNISLINDMKSRKYI